MCLNIYVNRPRRESYTYVNKKKTDIGKFIKRTGLNLPYCRNCPNMVGFKCLIAYVNNEGKDKLHTRSRNRSFASNSTV